MDPFLNILSTKVRDDKVLVISGGGEPVPNVLGAKKGNHT